MYLFRWLSPALRLRGHGIVLGFWSGVVVATLASCSTLGSRQPTAAPAPTGPSSPSATVVANAGSVPVPEIDKLREAAVNRASPAVVKIENVGTGLGSGVIMTNDGYVVTNHHVVAGAQQIRVTLANGSTLAASLVGSDSVDDIAVVKVSTSHLPVASFGDSTRLEVGQTVLALGNPLGITRTVTDGIVSALNRTVREGQGGGSIPNAIQTSAPINPGNSGGALINLAGQVVGVPTLAAVDPEFNTQANGIGFAIPSNAVVRIARQLIRYRKVIHSGRAAIGAYVASVTPDLAQQYNLPIDHGVLIASVVAGGGAARAGMKKGEVIVQVGSTPINTESDLLDALSKRSPGERVPIAVVTQNGKHRTYQVTLGELPVNSSG